MSTSLDYILNENNEIDKQIEKLLKNKLLSEKEIHHLCQKAKDIFINEENLHKIYLPVTVIGDIHGQFYDFQELLNITGSAPDTNFLFLGDYVDRGYQSIECISLVIAFKVRYKDRVCVLRGNHECRQLTQVYGFYDECIKKYGNANVWIYFTDLFDFLPLSALIENIAFCPHAGLSPALENLNAIQCISRIQEIPATGPICDLLWSDPDDRMGWGASTRGAGYTFGIDVSTRFLHTNKLSMIIRAHQLAMEGYDWTHGKQILTIFSAPNYCYRCGNLAAILQIDECFSLNFIQFKHAHNMFAETESYKEKMVPDYFL